MKNQMMNRMKSMIVRSKPVLTKKDLSINKPVNPKKSDQKIKIKRR